MVKPAHDGNGRSLRAETGTTILVSREKLWLNSPGQSVKRKIYVHKGSADLFPYSSAPTDFDGGSQCKVDNV
ncbi:MAG: hypothetical protein AAFR26_17160 [Cyanobacteria bacterium J06626_4]